MLPETGAEPIDVLPPEQNETLLPALAVGNAFTVTLTVLVLVQPVVVFVTVTV